MKRALLDKTCQIAFAGLVHQLNQFAHRADISFRSTVFEQTAPQLFADESGDPDARNSVRECLQSIQSDRSSPNTCTDWVVALAAHIAAGFEFERFDDHLKVKPVQSERQTRLHSLFEEVRLEGEAATITSTSLKAGFKLNPFSASAIFPQSLGTIENLGKKSIQKATDEYRVLWKKLMAAIEDQYRGIPQNHRTRWPLWLDAFETAWLTYTQSIPATTDPELKPDVSMYDHAKTTAALATALWRWHEAEGGLDESAIQAMRSEEDWRKEKFLLIQGDFFGIQNFIFSEGKSETNKKSAKILRGRSFYVSLLTELAALRVLNALQLPSTSQIINAAGKFLIVAPNTEEVSEALANVQASLEAWFLKHTFGTCGIGLVSTPATCQDFVGTAYEALTDRLFQTLECAKYQRFHLGDLDEPVFRTAFPNGVCKWQKQLAADGKADGESSPISRDQILIGQLLTSHTHLLIYEEGQPLPKDVEKQTCEVPIFGYRVIFAQAETARRLPPDGLIRCWDFSLPKFLNEELWHGCARRNINGYIPRYSEADLLNEQAIFGDDDTLAVGAVKTFETLSMVHTTGNQGVKGLMTMKGDVDSLGLIFRRGLTDDRPGRERIMTFAKTATLSRQLNAFFAVYLPILCAEEFKNVYTVFAGGDDFFLIGPWRETQHLAIRLAEDFKKFVANNPEVHFSIGMVMTKPKVPTSTLARIAEEALSEAKGQGKNRITLYGQTVTWDQFRALQEVEAFLSSAAERYGVSTSYLYSLFNILDMAGDKTRPEAAMWRSRLYYMTTRLFEAQRQTMSVDRQRARDEFLQTLLKYLEKHGSALRIPLTNTFYAVRRING